MYDPLVRERLLLLWRVRMPSMPNWMLCRPRIQEKSSLKV